MAGRWKSWLLQKKAGFLASFEMFSALRAGLAGEVSTKLTVQSVLRFVCCSAVLVVYPYLISCTD
jgi:hypothetical protein